MQKKKSIPNALLVAEREGRGWTQETVAQRIGTTAPNVSRWERGETRPGPYFRQRLSVLFGKSAQELGLVDDAGQKAQSTTEESGTDEAPVPPEQHTLPGEVGKPPGEPEPPRSQVHLSRRAVLSGLAGLVVLTVGGSGVTWLALHQRKPIPPGTTLCDYRGHTGRVRSVAWSPDGTRIASGAEDATVQIWSPGTFAGSPVRTYRRHLYWVMSVAWSPDGTRIASASKSVNIWDPTTGERVMDYHYDDTLVSMVAWSPDGTRIASASHDSTVQVWNALTGETQMIYTGHSNWITAVAWSPSGNLIASASRDGTVQVWDPRTGSPELIYRGHTGGVHASAWSPDGKSIASGGEDRTVQVWDVAQGIRLFTLSDHTAGVLSVAWNPAGSRVASGSQDKTVQVGDTTRRATILTYAGATGEVFATAWEPSGKLCVASGSGDHAVRVWKAV